MDNLTSETNLQIVGLSGSLRQNGFTRKAVEIALSGAQELGTQTNMLDLNDYNLEFSSINPKRTPENIKRLRRDVQKAHGIILGTPEYHGSYSGILKYAIDLMGFEEFEGKMIGLVGVSGGVLGAANALDSLRNIGRALHAWVVPQQVSIPQAWKHFDSLGNLTDPKLKERLLEVGRQVARFAYLHQSTQAIDFLEAWETAPPNPGGKR